MIEDKFIKLVESLWEKDKGCFSGEAYVFVADAVGLIIKRLGRSNKSQKERHLTGRELSEGIADIAIDRFGPVAFMVLKSWGISSTRNIGEIVFSLISAGILMKSPTDSIDDFEDVYNLEERLCSFWDF